ncbi:hypothetical protein BO443_40418 [Burkholderia orbicola]
MLSIAGTGMLNHIVCRKGVLSLRKDVRSLNKLSLNNWLPATCKGCDLYRRAENDRRIFGDGGI